MMPERKQSFQSHGIVQTCRLPCLLSHCRHLLLPISIRLNPQKSWKKCDHHIQIFKTSESDQKLFRRMWYDLFMKTSAREQPGYEWSPWQILGLALKPLSPCTLVEVPVGCLLACWGRHPCYNAVISLPSHQHPVCWVNPSSPLLSPPPPNPLPPNSLFIIPCFLSGIQSSTAMHPCAPTQWPRMTSTLHLTLGNLLTDFFFFLSIIILFCWFLPFVPLFLL